jgi:hypothetical protein
VKKKKKKNKDLVELKTLRFESVKNMWGWGWGHYLKG